MKKLFVVTISLIAFVAISFAQEDANKIIERSIQANAADWKATPEYDYFERDQEQDGGSKTFEERMILGSPYEQLVAINGKPLSPDREAEEQSKLEAAIAQRRSESAEQRASRIEKYERDRKRNQLLLQQLTKALNLVLVGEQKLEGHDVYVLKATPRPGYQPPNMETEVLLGMEGKLWIDKETFQWVKVEAQVIHPVSIEGFLARVEPGTRFELEKAPVEDEIWLPRHFAMRSRAKILFLFHHRSQADESYYGYHKAQASGQQVR